MRVLLDGLKAIAEPTRLRLLALLARAELTVTEITQVLKQSQPRVSRHLKLMVDAGLLKRFPEGTWVFYRLAEDGDAAALGKAVTALMERDDPVLAEDAARLDAIREARVTAAASYFAENASRWDEIRKLYLPEEAIEQAMAEMVGEARIGTLIDLGTGTGRMLELFADHYARGLGIDVNHAMLAYARTRLGQRGQPQANVRQGDIYNLSQADQSAGAVVMHQVLHFLSDPARAIQEAARVLEPGGDLLIVDFAPHDLEFLRDNFAHDRLGFSRSAIEGWVRDAGLEPVEAIDLKPRPSEASQKLTVSLWLARRPGIPARAAHGSPAPAHNTNLEHQA